MRKFVPGAVAGLVASAVLASSAFAGPTVTVRVEGATSTLLERTRVTLPDAPPPVAGCAQWTVAAAIEAATGGNWDRQTFTQQILGETHAFGPQSDYWAQWSDKGAGYRTGGGICTDVMQEGEEALMLVDFSPQAVMTQFPLDLEGLPAAVQAGAPVTVTVVRYVGDFTPGTGTRTPVEGATVAGGGATAVTGADGRATLSFPQTGTFAVKASKAGAVISAAEPVTVSTAPPPPDQQQQPPADDTTAPTAKLAGLANGKVFSRKRAPRQLRGTVSADPSGIRSVRLSITRRVGERCWAFDGAAERFARHRCGGSRSFRIGDRADWSYLLPKRLARGSYAIRVAAIDNAGNAASSTTRIRVK
jgi:hypothetical protein